MPKGVYPCHKPRSEEVRQKQAEAMRRYWASLSPTRKAEVGQKIGVSLTGRTQSEAHRKANSEGHKGIVPSEESRKKQSDSLKVAYREGRKQPVRSSHRKGTHHTEEAKAKIRESRAFQVIWNKGLKTGPRPQEVAQKISATLTGRKRVKTPAMVEGSKKVSLALMGRKASLDTRLKMSTTHRQLYANGTRRVSPKAGFGKGSFYDSPFQGKIWLRSTSEVQRARELDACGAVWFYEVERFPVILKGSKSSYTPDFWVVLGKIQAEVQDIEVSQFLKEQPTSKVRIEDVKGWWKPTHKTYPKILAFREQYPEINFEIVIRKGLT